MRLRLAGLLLVLIALPGAGVLAGCGGGGAGEQTGSSGCGYLPCDLGRHEEFETLSCSQSSNDALVGVWVVSEAEEGQSLSAFRCGAIYQFCEDGKARQHPHREKWKTPFSTYNEDLGWSRSATHLTLHLAPITSHSEWDEEYAYVLNGDTLQLFEGEKISVLERWRDQAAPPPACRSDALAR